jgi:ATP-dependent HslUV protease ATP-binding subunit HslU
MIRDLMEISISLVRAEKSDEVQALVAHSVEERLLDLLLPSSNKQGYAEEETPQTETREKFRKMLQDGKLETREIEIQVDDTPHVEVFSNMGLEEMGMNLQDMMKNLIPNKKKTKKLKIKEARMIVEQQEIAKLVDMDEVREIAVKRAEQSGIIFLDEIDKVCQREGQAKGGGDVSREGVQRDLLPIVEGSTVITKYGMVRTDHILFIAAGAFSLAKPSDLLPELQGRFPIRVELDNLTKEDFVRILTEPENSLTKQYTALMEQDGVFLKFTTDGIEAIAEMAFNMNQLVENIGARRLHTLLERVLEEVSFDAPACARGEISIDSEYVHARLDKVVQDKQTRSYIL